MSNPTETAPAPVNGGRFKVIVDTETAFVNLWRKTGEVLQALPGEIVDLFEGHPLSENEDAALTAEKQAFNDVHAATIAAHVEAGRLEATTEEPSPWPRVTEVVDEGVAAVDVAAVEQAKQEEAAAAQKQEEDAALAQQQLAANAADRAKAIVVAAAGPGGPFDPSTAPPA